MQLRDCLAARSKILLFLSIGLTRVVQAEEPGAEETSELISEASLNSEVVLKPVRLSDSAELERNRDLYTAGEYVQCSQQLTELLGLSEKSEIEPLSEEKVIEQARLYLATCALLAEQEQVAYNSMRAALEKNPMMLAPDSMSFPPPLLRLFSEVRAEVNFLVTQREEQEISQQREEQDKISADRSKRRERERELFRLASEQIVVAKSSRLIAALPFGAGQYQNGHQAWGHAFLVAEVAAASTTFGAWLALEGLNRKYELYGTATSGPQLVPADFNRKKSLALTTLTVAGWSWLGLTVVGIVDAQVRYIPERRLAIRRRVLPPELQSPPDGEETNILSDASASSGLDETQVFSDSPMKRERVRLFPIVSHLPGGAYLGLSGSF